MIFFNIHGIKMFFISLFHPHLGMRAGPPLGDMAAAILPSAAARARGRRGAADAHTSGSVLLHVARRPRRTHAPDGRPRHHQVARLY